MWHQVTTLLVLADDWANSGTLYARLRCPVMAHRPAQRVYASSVEQHVAPSQDRIVFAANKVALLLLTTGYNHKGFEKYVCWRQLGDSTATSSTGDQSTPGCSQLVGWTFKLVHCYRLPTCTTKHQNVTLCRLAALDCNTCLIC